MSREIDVRSFEDERLAPERAGELQAMAEEVSAALPGEHTVQVRRFDRTTGGVRSVASRGAPAEGDDYISRAIEHVRAIAPVLGLARAAPPEFAADPHVQRTASGAAVVNLRQQRDSIPIFQATETVIFNQDGSVRETTGSSIAVAATPKEAPALSALDAVRIAAHHVAEPAEDERRPDPFGNVAEPSRVNLRTFAPKVVEQDDSPARSTRITGEPFAGDILASRVWFPLSDELRPAWETLLTFPSRTSRFRVIVDAIDGRILFARELARTIGARGNVFQRDGGTARVLTDFPLPADAYFPGVEAPPGGFADWVDGRAGATSGNSVRAHEGEDGDPVRGTQAGGAVTFDFDAASEDQQVLNIFYFNCYMHDLCYLLGFREEDGNFQADNAGRGGRENDAVDARAFPQEVAGTATMLTLEDGTPPVMTMGMVSSSDRHTALDSSVVFHEYMHGVTNRLVGGPNDTASLDSPQSGGMGEGWSDWIACTINDSQTVGAWVVDDPAGIRSAPYDEDYPKGFDDIGPGLVEEVHDVGEIWAATLMSLNRSIGPALSAQLVVDALRLSAANPGFLDMRDHIMEAAALMEQAGQLERPLDDVLESIQDVFTRHGMGPEATSRGAQLTGIMADYGAGMPRSRIRGS